MLETSQLFHPYHSFLDFTLAEASSSKEHLSRVHQCHDLARIEHLDLGIIQLIPEDNSGSGGLILSAGIHGNETAPIELLNQLVSDCIAEKIKIKRPTLVIFGHPLAMKAAQRFVRFNMNRLFMGEHKNPSYHDSEDATRAKSLEQYALDFHSRFPVSEHLDLHTAIRESHISRFSLKPKKETQMQSALTERELSLLSLLGVQANVYQHKPGTTFSSFSARTFDCSAFTVELGKVQPFGQNDLDKYNDTYQCLCGLVSDVSISDASKNLQEYMVCHELLVDGADYALNIEDNAANFTQFKKGQLVASSSHSQYCAQHETEYLIFPNAAVPLGQRAGLLLERIDRRKT